jgi:signal transduction histidine kinase
MTTRQHKVVIIDDDAINRSRYRQFLERAQEAEYEIWEEERGETALATVKKIQPDAIVLDAQLSDLNGTKWLQQLTNDTSVLPFAIVALTSTADDVIPWATSRTTACESLAKDQITPELFCRAMRYVIERREWLRRLDERQHALADCRRKFLQAEARLQQARESEQLAAVGTTAVYLTHHLGNRFNNLSTSVQLLERRLNLPPTRLDPQLNQIVQEVHEEIRRSVLLLQNLRLLSNVHTLQVQPVEIAEVVNAVMKPLEQLYKKSGIQLVLDIPVGLPPTLADLEKFGQVLLNVCTNAIEAMPQGGTLTLRARAREKHITVAVHDTGIGIAPGLEVFAPFISTKPAGTGLGLTIARQLMVALQGTISYTSTPEQGTTFTLILPLTVSGCIRGFSPSSRD